jgi:hypothetical protein
VRIPDGPRTYEPPVAILKRLLVGRPLPSTEMEHQRISKNDRSGCLQLRRHLVHRLRGRGDPLRHRGRASSLILGLDMLVPIGIAVAILLALVVASYRQTIYAYRTAAAATS